MNKKFTNKGCIAFPFVLFLCMSLFPLVYFSATLSRTGNLAHTQVKVLNLESETHTEIVRLLETVAEYGTKAGGLYATPELEVINKNAISELRITRGRESVRTSLNAVLRTVQPNSTNVAWPYFPWKIFISKTGTDITKGQHENNPSKLSQFTCKFNSLRLTQNMLCAGNVTVTDLEIAPSATKMSIISNGDCEFDHLTISAQTNLEMICYGTITINRLTLPDPHTHLTTVAGGSLKLSAINRQDEAILDKSLTLHAQKGISLLNKRAGEHFPDGETRPLSNWPRFSLMGIAAIKEN